MIIESEKIILLHPGKTGGTSVEHTLNKSFLENKKLNAKDDNFEIMFGYSKKYRIYLQHADLRFYKNELNINLEKYKTITTVRNPYDRLVSCYFYNNKDVRFSFEEFVIDYLERHFLANEKYAVNHFCLQKDFCEIDDYKVDHIVKIENFKKDLEEIGINVVDVHHSKTARRKKGYESYYNKKTKDIVYNLYKEDFEHLGYAK